MELDPSRILFQGNGLLVIDKPAGIPVHRGTDHSVGLAETVEELARKSPGAIVVPPGRTVAPLHQLDREASGIVLFGLTQAAAAMVQPAFLKGLITKRYLAVVSGPLPKEGSIEGKVRSRLRGVYRLLPSHLDYRLLAGDERLSLVEVVPKEGRTHQIRSLFASRGRPLAGDLRYGKPKPARQFLEKFVVPQLLLHAIELTLPEGLFDAPRTFTAPVPEDFRRVAAQKGWIVTELG